MDYAFPADLARQVIDRWNTFVSRHDSPAPPLPRPRHLQHILETAFFASLEREEGRDLRFVLCCTPTLEVRSDGFDELVPVVPFQAPRPLSVEAIRSLAPAASPSNAAILIQCPPEQDEAGPCEITGILNVGSNLARARSGRSFYHRPAPYALVIDVRDAGELHIYRGGIKLASLSAGRLLDQLAFSGLEFLPISDILARGTAALASRITAPPHETSRDTSDFEWTALLNTILCVVNGVKEQGHGGTVLLVAPGAETSLPMRMKYDIDERVSVLADRFAGFVNSRHELAEARWIRKTLAEASDGRAAALSYLQSAAFVAEEDLADAADLVARLSCVDGALVLRSDLRVLGFGTEIVLDAARPVTAYEVQGHPRRSVEWPAVDSESFGMRHRSALRLVAVADATAAFVVSQDGTVSFFWKHDGRVLLKRNVNTANPNMIGA
jgi:Probable sensor domain DACNV